MLSLHSGGTENKWPVDYRLCHKFLQKTHWCKRLHPFSFFNFISYLFYLFLLALIVIPQGWSGFLCQYNHSLEYSPRWDLIGQLTVVLQMLLTDIFLKAGLSCAYTFYFYQSSLIIDIYIQFDVSFAFVLFSVVKHFNYYCHYLAGSPILEGGDIIVHLIDGI